MPLPLPDLHAGTNIEAYVAEGCCPYQIFSTSAVSYTHLDVYKRQGLQLVTFFQKIVSSISVTTCRLFYLIVCRLFDRLVRQQTLTALHSLIGRPENTSLGGISGSAAGGEQGTSDNKNACQTEGIVRIHKKGRFIKWEFFRKYKIRVLPGLVEPSPVNNF